LNKSSNERIQKRGNARTGGLVAAATGQRVGR
jgi:hypothetical protein